jgi:hypothetical protein
MEEMMSVLSIMLRYNTTVYRGFPNGPQEIPK